MHLFRLLPVLGLFVLFLAGCEGMAFHNAELTNTPESYEEFLAKFPDSERYEEIQVRVEELRFDAAIKADTSKALKNFLMLHPTGAHADKARAAEDVVSYEEAAAQQTIAAFESYIAAHPEGQNTEQAQKHLDRLHYLPRVAIENVRTEAINLAADPKGPLNGWAVLANVINQGNRTLQLVELDIQLLDKQGQLSGEPHTWWAVSRNLGGFPTPPAMKPPLAPGASRGFRWTTGDTPAGWTEQLTLSVSEVVFEF